MRPPELTFPGPSAPATGSGSPSQESQTAPGFFDSAGRSEPSGTRIRAVAGKRHAPERESEPVGRGPGKALFHKRLDLGRPARGEPPPVRADSGCPTTPPNGDRSKS